jgi:autotransporter-associated beta strand protein
MKTRKTEKWSAGVVVTAIALGGLVHNLQASLLVYEPFEFEPGQCLDGLGGGEHAIGMVGTWTAMGSGTIYPGTNAFQVIAPGTAYGDGPFWKGYVTSVPQKGNYAGSPAKHNAAENGNDPNQMWASRELDPSVTAKFAPGSTTWMSYIQAHNFAANNNYIGCEFVIGAGVFIGTGDASDPAGSKVNEVYGGPAVGFGLTAIPGWGAAPKALVAGMFDENTSDLYYLNQKCRAGAEGEGIRIPATTNGPPIICIAKIEWGDTWTPTTVSITVFTNGAVLTEEAFNNGGSVGILHSATGFVDPTRFKYISLGGGRYNVDELRIGTTFEDVIGIEQAAFGKYWAPTANGGTGTWAVGINNWASVPNVAGTLAQSPNDRLIFAGEGGTVTVDGTVTVFAGLQFAADKYNLVPVTPTAQIQLAGGDAAANTIVVATGTATNAVQVAGSNGLTISGPGTLVLGHPDNTYGGGTVLAGGTLQIAALGSLGTGNLNFEGGILQYPPGKGVTSLDVSSKIPTITSGQSVQIDTGGWDVTFRSPIAGDGGLTKLGDGSLTLAAVNTYTGTTTVKAGTLNLSGASGVIRTLEVPAGGTVNLGAGAVVTALNITGGTVNVTGPGVQVDTLLASGGKLTDSAGYSLAVAKSANLNGTLLVVDGAASIKLSGTDIISPSTSSPRLVSVASGTLSIAGAGHDVAIGISAPGAPAVAATTSFLGNDAWALVDGIVDDINDTYGRDNHAFHYIPLPTGDFDIKLRVTGTTNAAGGLMARDNLTARGGNMAGIWTTLGNAARYPFSQYPISATTSNRAFSMLTCNLEGVLAPWLRVKKEGMVVGTYYSEDGINYTLAQEVDYSSSPWGPTTYIGLDLINTLTTGGSASFDEVNFMGASGIVDMSTTEFELTGGAKLNLGPVMYVGKISAGGTVLADGCWAGSAVPGANHVDPTIFTSSGPGIAVIGIPLTVTAPDVTVTTTDPWSEVQVSYPAPVVVGGTPPYTTKYFPESGSWFPVGVSTATCMVKDSSCPFSQTRYSTFRVRVVPPAPVMNPAVDVKTGFALRDGVPTFTFSSVPGFRYRVVYTDRVDVPASGWLPVVSDEFPQGWVVATEAYTTIVDSGQLGPARFYRVEATSP